jgi:tetratricopeptide (TPR) repeat protein
MDFTEQLRVLEAAQGDPAKLALATVDLAYPHLTQSEADKLKQALEAAAIPHWCDESILSGLLEISTEESAARLNQLRGLKVMEPFRARGDNASNVHEATRLALRRAMATGEQKRFRSLSKNAAAFFANDLSPTGRIEWIYHLLCDDPEPAADELEKMNRDWERSASTEDRYALAAALRELEKSQLVEGRARVWTLLGIAWVRVSRGEAAQMMDVAIEVLRLAQSVGDQPAEADAQCMVGDVWQAQGKLPEAALAFAKYQTISEQLAAQDRSSERLAAVATAHSRIGGVLEAQNRLEEAREKFSKCLSILESLIDKEPDNWSWRREVAAAHSRVGDVLRAQGKSEEALAELEHYLTIAQQLVKQNPGNSEWQQDLATAHSLIGDALRAQGRLAEAQTAFGEDLKISQQWVEQEPTHARWQERLMLAHSRLGDVWYELGDPAQARTEFEKSLVISRRLAEQDMGNANLQRGLAGTCVSIARLDAHAGKIFEALPIYEEAKRIFEKLVEGAPEIVRWREEKEIVESELTTLRERLSKG